MDVLVCDGRTVWRYIVYGYHNNEEWYQGTLRIYHCRGYWGKEYDGRVYPYITARLRCRYWVCRVFVVSVCWSSGCIDVYYHYVGIGGDYHRIDRKTDGFL